MALPFDPSGRVPIPLRPHNLLCLQGFRGMGYDEGFAHNMARVHGLLLVSPGARILVVAEPDHLCSACPHLAPDQDGGAGCAPGGICTTCPWLPAGVCAEGIAALSAEGEAPARGASGVPEKGIP